MLILDRALTVGKGDRFRWLRALARRRRIADPQPGAVVVAQRSGSGAIGKKGSVAVIERFVRSHAGWDNEHRPSRALAGRTPKEGDKDLPPKNEEPRFEPRRKWPVGSPCAAPLTSIEGKRGSRLASVLKFMEGRRHLTVIELQRAA